MLRTKEHTKFSVLRYTYANPSFEIYKNFLSACRRIEIHRESELFSVEQKDQADSYTAFFSLIELTLHIAL